MMAENSKIEIDDTKYFTIPPKWTIPIKEDGNGDLYFVNPDDSEKYYFKRMINETDIFYWKKYKMLSGDALDNLGSELALIPIECWRED